MAILSCHQNEPVETNPATPTKTIITAQNEAERPKIGLLLGVVEPVDRSAAELDQIFGASGEISANGDGGEFRLYRIVGEPKRVAVRFYGGKARSFNLLLSKPASTARLASQRAFGLDVGTLRSPRNVKEPLSERYQGTFGGLKFSKISAKKDEWGRGFILVLAQAAR